VPSGGCGAESHPEITKEAHVVEMDGTERSYFLYAPEGSEPTPLVLDIHGLLEGADVHTMQTKMGEFGLEHGFATVFPHGSGTPVHWEAADVDSPDLDFIDVILDEVGEQRCIDTSRVYAMGLSNGAMMTSLLACTRSNLFAAFAPVAGLLMPAGCDPPRRPPILAFHGTADPILRFNGGITLNLNPDDTATSTAPLPEPDLDGEGYPETARQWADKLGCDAESSDEEVTDEVIRRTWECPDGATIEFVIIVGGGHTWPGSDFMQRFENMVGPSTHDIDANEASWEFFQRYQLPAA
jgi:polyhydroxybutyrate depolymerase